MSGIWKQRVLNGSSIQMISVVYFHLNELTYRSTQYEELIESVVQLGMLRKRCRSLSSSQCLTAERL